ncbi:MAG: ATP-binding protein [Pseudomonadota bacterium]|nr:ATP-binding protein [Pseudomonadota bacterium]
MMFSIRRFLMLTLLAVILGGGLLLGWGTYRTLHHELDEQYDAELVQSGRLIASFWSEGEVPDPAAVALAPEEHRYQRYFIYQLWQRSQLVLGSAGAPDKPLIPLTDSNQRRLLVERNGWHVYGIALPGERWVVVAESDAARHSLGRNMAGTVLAPYLLSVPLVLILVALAIRWGLWPLTRLARAVTARHEDNLTPLRHRRVRELAPLTQAINALLARLVETLEREKRFTADAGHELRTLLMALRLHADNAVELSDPEDVAASMSQLRRAIDRASRTVEQLMVLSRLDPRSAPRTDEYCDGAEVAQEVLAIVEPLAMQHGHQVTSVLAPGLSISIPAEMLQMVLRNLLDNACRYSPPASRLALSGYRDGGEIVFVIADGGPGLTQTQQQRFSGRFSRGRHDVPGAGLGLSIVQRILDLYHGTLCFQLPAPDRPAAAEVRLPAA